MNIRTVAIYSEEDRLALHRFKADEAYQVRVGKKPIAAYLVIPDIIRIAREAGVDAINRRVTAIVRHHNPSYRRR